MTGQRTDSIGQTVLQMVAKKTYFKNKIFENTILPCIYEIVGIQELFSQYGRLFWCRIQLS